MYQVLIVDDEPIVKIALRSMLDWGSLGFYICGTASNGQEALEMAERMHPDLMKILIMYELLWFLEPLTIF